jgi:3-oxoacyl-[acyl-carrier protein] reductase
MDLQIAGKTALVLGGSKGLGRGIANALSAEGVAVSILARGQEAIDKTVAEINGRGGRAIGTAADLADWASVERAVSTTRQQLGPIDILINNSGGPPPSPVSGVAPELWEAQFRQMVLVFFRLTDLVLPDMRARKWGRIINIASESVVQPIAAIGISNTLRSSVVGWAKTLSGEVARDGITVNTMLPGPFATDRIANVARATAQRQNITIEEVSKRIANNVPVGRIGDPAEFGAIGAFLASHWAGYITGSMIRVEGGTIRSV